MIRSTRSDFETISTLGSGTFGRVYLVRRKRDLELYAMKEARRGGDRRMGGGGVKVISPASISVYMHPPREPFAPPSPLTYVVRSPRSLVPHFLPRRSTYRPLPPTDANARSTKRALSPVSAPPISYATSTASTTDSPSTSSWRSVLVLCDMLHATRPPTDIGHPRREPTTDHRLPTDFSNASPDLLISP